MEIKASWVKLKETLKKGFTSHTPNSILLDEYLHQSSKTVFGILNSLCFASKHDCRPSQALIGYLANVSVKTVSRAIKELESYGHIKVKRVKGEVCTYTMVAKFAQKVENEVRNRIKQAQEFIENKRNKNQKNNKDKKQSNWNLDNQRDYDYDSLEKQLLGWSIEIDLNGLPYEQMCLT